MEELKITISGLKQDKQELEIKVDDFSRYGRSPKDEDYFEMISLLENWRQIKSEINCLEQVVDTIVSNQDGL